MSKVPEFVVTGLHMPAVSFWARVLVSPDRLAEVKESVLRYGTAHLRSGDRLEIETECGGEKGVALSVGSAPKDGPFYWGKGYCIVAWNERAGGIDFYADDQDQLAAMHGPLVDALFYRNRIAVGQAWLDADKVTSIQVGNVLVYFERPDDAKPPRKEEGETDDVVGFKLSPGAEFTLPPGTVISGDEIDLGELSDAAFEGESGPSTLKVLQAHLKIAEGMKVLRQAGLSGQGV